MSLELGPADHIRHLVSIGALATVLLLVFSPSTQLTNTIRVRNVDITSAVSHTTIGRSVQYMNPAWNTSLVDFDRHRLFNTSRIGDTNCMWLQHAQGGYKLTRSYSSSAHVPGSAIRRTRR
jgi:hypothetical protein